MKTLILAPGLALSLSATSTRAAQLHVALPASLPANMTGRLLLFVEPATAANAGIDHVDLDEYGIETVTVTAREVAGFGAARTVTFNMHGRGFSTSLASLAPGTYKLQAVLDPNHDYAYAGRGPGDYISEVATVHLPLTTDMTIPLDRALPPLPDQFDTTGLPPIAAQQIAASRPHLHDEHIPSPTLAQFHGAPRSIAAWVLTPPGYDPASTTTYPTVYTAGGFGTTHRIDGQLLSKTWHMMETGAIPPMIWVALDYATIHGTTEFADSANNGPWGKALVQDVIPALEKRYRMDAKPSGRFLTGHSSGGWFALWAMMQYPQLFGGSWSTSPDPVDFHSFIGVNLYARDANMYHDASGADRPLERDAKGVRKTIKQEAQQEAVLGRDGDGGQLRSFEWVFSPRSAGGKPANLFNRRTGKVDQTVAAYWRKHYDIGHALETEWPKFKGFEEKIHLRVGTADSFYLNGAVLQLEATLRRVGGKVDISYAPGASHSMAEVYARGSDRNGYLKEITRAMYTIARPMQSIDKDKP